MSAIDELLAALREQASRTLMFHQAVTEGVGLGPSDIKALDLARTEEGLTAGRLAQITGLSTSATTAVLDRLEQRGFVERRRDPTDRRRVVVVSTRRDEQEVGGIFADLETWVRDLLAGYDDDQLALLIEFTQRLNRESAERTRTLTSSPRRSRSHPEGGRQPGGFS